MTTGVIAVAVGQASQTPAQQPTFRSGIGVIQLDVTVLDDRRRPLRGLTAEDFDIRENGQPRAIVGFSEVAIPTIEEPPDIARWVTSAPRDVATNDLPNGRLLVIVMDDATIPPVAAMIRDTKRIASGVVERMGPSDLAAVVFTRDNRYAQDFTSDRAKLNAAIERFSVGYLFTDSADQWYWYGASIRTLSNALEYLAGVPDRRKAAIYVSIGVPRRIREDDTARLGDPEATSARETAASVDNATRRLFQRALRANVNVYAVDPGGLAGLDAFFQARGMDPYSASQIGRAYRENLRTVANNTGGRAILDTNDFNSGLDQIFVETSHYYFLGYQSAEPVADGRFRRLEVRVKRRGATVIARNGYFAVTPPGERSEPVPSRLDDPIAELLPKGDIPLEVTTAAFAQPGERPGAVAIVLALTLPPTADAPKSGEPEIMELQTRVFTIEGKPVKSESFKAEVPRQAFENGRRVELLSFVDLPPGRHALRLSAYRPSTDKSGGVHFDVEVPDFQRSPLSLSGLMLTAASQSPIVVSTRFQSFLPVEPTTLREFTATDRVDAFLRVYQGAGTGALHSVTLATTIVDDRNAVVHSTTVDLTPDRFDAGSRAADVRLPLPIATLKPGRYLLTVVATMGDRTMRREVRFTCTTR